MASSKKLIDQIVEIEWKMLQEIHGMDGRASCQDDFETFYIMRSSNYSPWPESILKSYFHDLKRAKEEKRNLVLEKYAYMMSIYDATYYKENLESFMPPTNVFVSKMIREIVSYYLSCEKDFQKNYPKMSAKGRYLNTSGFDAHFASIETYATGELRTYSPQTLRFLLEFIRTEKSLHHNIVSNVREAMVKMYGYDSLEDAEEKIELRR